MTTVDDIEFIVPCGGKSTRNYPHSKGLPHKSFMPFGDGRLIDRILADIVHAGGRHITIVCSGSDVVERFREALAPDPDMVEKLRQKGRPEIADALEATFLPPDTDLKYVVQDKPIGTAHVLGLAHRLSPHRHAMLVFPDDVILSHDPQNTHFQRLIRAFLEDPRQVLLTGVEKEDVSNNAIIYKNRLIEKPKVAYNHVGGFSPIVIPRQTLDFIMGQVDTYERTGKLPDNLPMAEWVYTDGINQFLDTQDPDSGFTVRMFLKRPDDLLLDTGTLPLYQTAQVRALLTLSRFKVENRRLAQELLNYVA